MIKKAITKKETPVDWERLAKNLQEASQKKGNCHEHGSGCTCNSREQPESPD